MHVHVHAHAHSYAYLMRADMRMCACAYVCTNINHRTHAIYRRVRSNIIHTAVCQSG